ncbi:MAG TPA: mitochondrial fission ELM1 family protein, partial [Rickettsia endosymbiont of Pyrocoelia pectoralis]|nr:mitochondrial fission ELM1 family protein [Rickettsia endosymbiont of Pyrocoelia pectoralis]
MRIWVLADDRTGNTNQAIALAEKLAGEYTLIKLEYNCLAKLPNFLLKYYPVHIKNEILRDIFARPLPDIIITAGRRTAVLAFYLKKKLGRDIKLIQIMQPCLPYSEFEAIILPYHDLLSYRGLTTVSSQSINNITENGFLDTVVKPREDNNISPINGGLDNMGEKFATAGLGLQKYCRSRGRFRAGRIDGSNRKFSIGENEGILFCTLITKRYK